MPHDPVTHPSSALGSLLCFIGTACCHFSELLHEPQQPALSQALAVWNVWNEFFTQAGMENTPDQSMRRPMEILRSALKNLREDEHFRQEALIDYNALFHAPELMTPLWESVWLSGEGLLFTEETFAVRDWYARFGWEILHSGREAEDHIGLETAFCGWLYDLENAVPDAPLLCVFLREHYSLWAPQCFAALRLTARTPFWRSLLTIASLLAANLEKH